MDETQLQWGGEWLGRMWFELADGAAQLRKKTVALKVSTQGQHESQPTH